MKRRKINKIEREFFDILYKLCMCGYHPDDNGNHPEWCREYKLFNHFNYLPGILKKYTYRECLEKKIKPFKNFEYKEMLKFIKQL